MRAFVVGAAGQLGRALVAVLRDEIVWAGGRAELDVTSSDAVNAKVLDARPDVIFNAAAYNKVDGAEAETAKALEVNALAPWVLARAARKVEAALVHFSTDYVFDGRAREPYSEEVRPNPLGAYGASKLSGEALVGASGAEALVVRTSAVFVVGGSRQKGGSFVDRILEQARAGKPLRVVADQVFSPTYAPDLAVAAVHLARAGARGLHHVANAGACTWHDLALAALRRSGLPDDVERIRAADLNLPARRPAYSVLDTARYRASGGPPMRGWEEALAASLAAGAESVPAAG